jgi:hypothetical protein
VGFFNSDYYGATGQSNSKREFCFRRNDNLRAIVCRSNRSEETMTIKQELLDILACPKCKGDIYLNEPGDGLICDHCRLLYEIRDDIPIMLIDEAKPVA